MREKGICGYKVIYKTYVDGEGYFYGSGVSIWIFQFLQLVFFEDWGEIGW